jgi:hypothetical protein
MLINDFFENLEALMSHETHGDQPKRREQTSPDVAGFEIDEHHINDECIADEHKKTHRHNHKSLKCPVHDQVGVKFDWDSKPKLVGGKRILGLHDQVFLESL